MRKLSELNIGDSGEIVDFSDHELALKMVELGCLPGEKIKLLKISPLGCPVIYSIGEHKLSMRIAEAEKIIVRCQ